jgi:PAS domain S-box-containing protein
MEEMSYEDHKGSEERYLNLIQQASDGIININQQNVILEFNRKCEEIFQYTRDEVVGRRLDILIPLRLFPIHKKGIHNLPMIKEFEQSGRTIEAVGVRKDGTEFPIEISFFFLEKGKPYIFTSIIRDITKRKEIEKKIKRQNLELVTINSITQAISQSLNLEEVLYLALERTLETLNAEEGAIFLKEGMNGVQFLPVKGIVKKKSLGYVESQSWIGEDMIEEVIKKGDITSFDECLLNRKGLLKKKSPKRIRSLVSVPLKSKDKVVGVMNIGAHRKDLLSKDDIPLLKSIGSTIGMAIENARLFQEISSKSIEIEDERKKLKQLTEKLIRTQDDERRWILRELHDEAGQLMSTLKIDLEIIKKELPLGNIKLKGIFENAVNLVDKTTSEMRRISSHLHPSILDTLGLIPAIESYIEDCKRRFNVAIDFNYTGFKERMDYNLETVLYRSVQESLMNVWKHAEAKYVSLNLVKSPNMIIAMIRDDGKGFDAAKVLSSKGNETGLGLLGIRERVSLVGGRVKITSKPGSGTTLRIEIPR